MNFNFLQNSCHFFSFSNKIIYIYIYEVVVIYHSLVIHIMTMFVYNLDLPIFIYLNDVYIYSEFWVGSKIIPGLRYEVLHFSHYFTSSNAPNLSLNIRKHWLFVFLIYYHWSDISCSRGFLVCGISN